MGLPKGKTNNPNGRKKGSKNKSTAEIKTAIQSFISSNVDGLQENYDKLEPKDKATFIERMLKYVIPTQTKADIQVQDNSLENIKFVIKGRDDKA
jgi:hypothetical protein